MPRPTILLVLAGLLLVGPAASQQLSTEQHISAAVAPLPTQYRDGAEVRFKDGDGWQTIREGNNEMICLGDEPNDDRFHVACYHESLEPFMERGRELRREGYDRDRMQEIREQEARSGELQMPEQAAALYSLTGESFDAQSNTVTNATPLFVVYMPYATLESTGLPAQAPRGQPWLMNPGMPWAHIMLVGPEPPGKGQ